VTTGLLHPSVEQAVALHRVPGELSRPCRPRGWHSNIWLCSGRSTLDLGMSSVSCLSPDTRLSLHKSQSKDRHGRPNSSSRKTAKPYTRTSARCTSRTRCSSTGQRPVVHHSTLPSRPHRTRQALGRNQGKETRHITATLEASLIQPLRKIVSRLVFG